MGTIHYDHFGSSHRPSSHHAAGTLAVLTAGEYVVTAKQMTKAMGQFQKFGYAAGTAAIFGAQALGAFLPCDETQAAMAEFATLYLLDRPDHRATPLQVQGAIAGRGWRWDNLQDVAEAMDFTDQSFGVEREWVMPADHPLLTGEVAVA